VIDDPMKFLNLWINLGLLALMAGAAFTFGCASVCKLMSMGASQHNDQHLQPARVHHANRKGSRVDDGL
jgi:hypothetical protein